MRVQSIKTQLSSRYVKNQLIINNKYNKFRRQMTNMKDFADDNIMNGGRYIKTWTFAKAAFCCLSAFNFSAK